MTDDEIMQHWREAIARSAGGWPGATREAFFRNFPTRFSSAMSIARLKIEDLKRAAHELLSGTCDDLRVQDVYSAMRAALHEQLEVSAAPRNEKEYRPGSGNTIKDGGNQDTVKIREPRRGRWV